MGSIGANRGSAGTTRTANQGPVSDAEFASVRSEIMDRVADEGDQIILNELNKTELTTYQKAEDYLEQWGYDSSPTEVEEEGGNAKRYLKARNDYYALYNTGARRYYEKHRDEF